MGRTNSPEPMGGEPIVLPTWRRVSEEDYNSLIELIESYERIVTDTGRELERLHEVESAALKVVGTMPRRNGKPYSFTMATLPAIEALDATLQQDEEDENDD